MLGWRGITTCANLSEIQIMDISWLVLYSTSTYRYVELYQGVHGGTEFRCIWSLQKNYCRAEGNSNFGCVRTWPAPTLMKHILWQGLVWDQTSPNKLLMNISIHGLDNQSHLSISQLGRGKLLRTSGRSPCPIVLYVFEIRCNFIRTATLRLTQNRTDAASFFWSEFMIESETPERNWLE